MNATRCCIAASIALLLALASIGCNRRSAENPCAAAVPAVLELRTREGAPEILVKRPAAGPLTVCDGAERSLGTLVRGDKPRSLALRNAAGDVEASIARGPGPSDDPLLSHRDRTLRLHEQDDLLRILDAQGVPVGQIGHADDGRVAVYDPGGRPVATSEKVESEKDRRAIRKLDGAVSWLVIGCRDDRAAAAFALEGLPPVERLLLHLWLEP